MTISSISNVTLHVAAPVEASASQASNNQQHALISAVKAVNAAQSFGRDNEITFRIDPRTRRTVLRIVDRETGDLVGQIPAEEVLRMADQLKERE